MMTKSNLLLILLLSTVFSQIDINFSLETQYGDGLQVTNQGAIHPDTSDYNYFENILDISTSYQNIYLFTQFEYSDPPIYGLSANKLNKLYFDYNQNRLNVRAGDLYSIYGRGISFSTYFDQSIDIDNSIRGLEINYELYPDINLYSLLGKGSYYYRTNPANLIADRQIDHSALLFGTEVFSDITGDFRLFYLEQKQEISEELIYSYEGEIHDTEIARELFDRVDLQSVAKDTVSLYSRNLTWNKYFSGVDLYLERAWNSYRKILGGMTSGSMTYGAVSTDIAGYGIIYEYKDYDMPFFIQTLSSPPIVMREASSVLVPRNNHSINFADEVGHQLEITGKIAPDLTVLFNYALASRKRGFGTRQYHHFNLVSGGGSVTGYWQDTNPEEIKFSKPSITDIIKFERNESLYSQYPYRQWHMEFDGWLMGEKLFYKIGYNDYKEVISYLDQVIDYYQSDYTQTEIHTMISDYFTEYFWNIWETNYHPEFGLDSTYADQVFEGTYGGNSVDTMIMIETGSSISEIDGLLDEPVSTTLNYETVAAYTLPMQFAFNAGNIGAFTLYLEHQRKNLYINKNVNYEDGTTDSSLSQKEVYDYQYISLTYRHPADFSITLFYDSEDFVKRQDGVIWSDGTHEWKGVDFSCDINDNSQISVFFGSQKGGRICANGICADQPGFEDGFKITYRSIF